MARSNCELCKERSIVPVVCHQGLQEDACPKNRLENEKLLYGALLVGAVALLVWTHCC